MKAGDLAIFNLPGWQHKCWLVESKLFTAQEVTANLLYNSPKIYLKCEEFNGHLVEIISPNDMNIVYIPALQLYTAEFEDDYFIKL